MRAVILAGGEGSRLRPLSMGSCKPMTWLMGRPVLAHIIDLLKDHGITQLVITLCHHPEAVMSYFGDGSQLGVSITYFVEETPLGTAGGVKACMEQLAGEDFLVIGGDCVCNLDISQAIRLHERKGGAATLVLYPHKTPLEYGLVHLDVNGRITHFLEKPTWGQVMTNLVNTGIYILTQGVLDRVPEGEVYDFGRDLFPTLLAEGQPLYGAVLEGYWRDMGDCHSYLQCCFDLLHGLVQGELDIPKIGEGIWSASAIPEDVTVIAPCYIGSDVTLRPHCLVGPHVVVEAGCEIGSRAMVQRSVILKEGVIEPGAVVFGAIVCPRAQIGEGAIVHRGAVVGEGAHVERGSTVMEEVRIWPGRRTPRGGRVHQSIVSTDPVASPVFGEGGVIRGIIGQELDVQTMMKLGGVMASWGELLLGCSGGDGGKIFAQAFASGVGAAGGVVRLHALQSPAQSSWLAQRREASVALFVEQEGERCFLHFAGGDGLPLERGRQRKIEAGLRAGEVAKADGGAMGKLISLGVDAREYSRDMATRTPLYRVILHPVTLAVGGETAGDGALRRALSMMGCTVLTGWRQGVPLFSTCHGGQRLVARDEEGAEVDSGQLLAILTLIEMENGCGEVAVPAAATAAVELVAAGFGGKVLRLGRDGQAAEHLYCKLPWLRDGSFAAVRIASRMAVTGESLGQLLKKIPRLTAQRREIPLRAGRGQIMERLAAESDQGADGGEGIRVHARGGWVYLAPLSRRAALQVVAEGADMELSAELCDSYAAHVEALDCLYSEQDSQQSCQKSTDFS